MNNRKRLKQWFLKKREWLEYALVCIYWWMILESFLLYDWAYKTFFRKKYEKQQEIDRVAILREQDVFESGLLFGYMLDGLPIKLRDCKLFFIDGALIEAKLKKEALKVRDEFRDVYGSDCEFEDLELFEKSLMANLLIKTCSVFSASAKNNVTHSKENDAQDPYLEILAEIANACSIDGVLARNILLWCFSAALYKPYIFPDFKVEIMSDGKTINLVSDDKKFETPGHRWFPSELHQFI